MEQTREAVEARRAYMREWKRKNRDRVKEYNAQYWARKAEKAAAKKEQEASE